MKHAKQLLSFMLTLIMVFAMTVPGRAEGTTQTISVPSDDSHTYAVYQIFTGNLQGDKNLSDLKWGQNGTETEGTKVSADVIKALESIKNSTSDSAKLEVIKNYVDLDSTAFNTVDKDHSITVPTGYYLIKDNANLSDKNDAYTTYIVQVNGPVEIQRKEAKPTVDKQVKDESKDKDINSTDAEGWGETADHAINEVFKFQLKATIPDDEDFDAYKTYQLTFNDTLSKGLTYLGNIEVKVNGNKIESGYTISENAVSGAEGPLTWSLTIADLKAHVETLKGAVVTVTYDAKLNEEAVIGNKDGNRNTVNLQYSNNPNSTGTGTPETGKTPDDTVFVFTYDVNNNKQDDLGQALEGAEFKLYEADGTTEVPLYKAEDGNYYPVGNTGKEAVTMVSTGTEKAVFNIKGLDAGTYVLKETKAPEGYQLAAPIEIVISANHNEDTETTATTVFSESAKNMNNTVVDTKNSSLPTTGGMGTTIFYIVGAVLVVGAGVLLVTRKRMEGNR